MKYICLGYIKPGTFEQLQRRAFALRSKNRAHTSRLPSGLILAGGLSCLISSCAVGHR